MEQLLENQSEAKRLVPHKAFTWMRMTRGHMIFRSLVLYLAFMVANSTALADQQTCIAHIDKTKIRASIHSQDSSSHASMQEDGEEEILAPQLLYAYETSMFYFAAHLSSNCNKKLIGARAYFKGYEKYFGKKINETVDYLSPRDSQAHGTHTTSTAAGDMVKNANFLGQARGTATGMSRGQAPTPSYRPYLSQPSYAANSSFAHQTRPRQQQGYYPPQRISTEAWRAGANASPNLNASQNTNPRRNQFVNFTPIPMTYTELLPNLVEKGLVAICPMKPVQPPYPRGYDANAKCSYHGGGVGHSTEGCMTFKYKIQALIDSKWLQFQEDKPSVKVNPLSRHERASMNVVEVKEHELVKDALLKVGLVKGDYDIGITCVFHPTVGHSIEECVEFKEFMQDLLDRSLMQVCYEGKKGLSEERIERRTQNGKRIRIYDIKKRFHRDGRVSTGQIAVVEDEDGSEGSSFVLVKQESKEIKPHQEERALMETQLEEAEWVQARFDQLISLRKRG
ncbi:hypothetical protein V8G54_028800 [Vigna mungo]|uniref:Uncharacterized protein n=1 Tax=Vigna mungo TaxID=3915 RepID=A0AAQ3MTL7_VIGMU